MSKIKKIGEDQYVISLTQLRTYMYLDRYVDYLYEAGVDNWQGMEYMHELIMADHPKGLRAYYQSDEWVNEVVSTE